MTNKPERKLLVSIDGHPVGTLIDTNGIWCFQYADTWIKDKAAFDIAPYLPRVESKIIDSSSHRPVQWFFDNLLPEEGARTLLARDKKLDRADAFGLLQAFGAESAGALTLLLPGEQPDHPEVQPLSFDELSRRIQQLPSVSLAQGASKRMSLAGAQHKLPVIFDDGQLYEPLGSMPSTHILKPEHHNSSDYWHTTANEWFIMRLAYAVGLDVPEVILCHIPEAIYLIKRFDRVGEYPAQFRRHTLDACQLLGLDRHYKYQQSNAETLGKLVQLARQKARTQVALLKWAYFNALVGNGDAHLKNLSFFVQQNGYELTPHYDLLCTAIYNDKDDGKSVLPYSELSQAMGETRLMSDVTFKDVIDFAKSLGIAKQAVSFILKPVYTKIIPAAEQLLVVAVTDSMNTGQVRTLREIYYKVIKEMHSKLQPK